MAVGHLCAPGFPQIMGPVQPPVQTRAPSAFNFCCLIVPIALNMAVCSERDHRDTDALLYAIQKFPYARVMPSCPVTAALSPLYNAGLEQGGQSMSQNPAHYVRKILYWQNWPRLPTIFQLLSEVLLLKVTLKLFGGTPGLLYQIYSVYKDFFLNCLSCSLGFKIASTLDN